MDEFIASGRTNNSKTDDVPTIAVGTDTDSCLQSCKLAQCALLHRRDGGLGGGRNNPNPLCYSQYGTAKIGFIEQAKAYKRARERGDTERYTLRWAMKRRLASAGMIRIGSIGDPVALSEAARYEIVQVSQDAGLHVVGYTHGWRDCAAESWSPWLRASCESLEQADEAAALGWRSAVVLPAGSPAKQRTPAGQLARACPAQLTDIKRAQGKRVPKVTCNDCGGSRGPLCTSSNADVVILYDHSPGRAGAQVKG